jgi:anaerobic C4-dicarboxylate transporter
VEWIIIAVILMLIYVSDVLGGHLVALIWGAIGLIILVIARLTRDTPSVRKPQDQSPDESNPKRPAA